MLENIKAAIFDLDGTLVDSMWIWRSIDEEYLGRFGIECPDDIQIGIEGMSFSETAVYFKERFHIPDSLEKMKSDWNEMARDKYRNEVPMKPGAIEFLQKCKECGLKLGIATSNSRELVEEIGRTHGFQNYFDVIMTACEVDRGKPFPDVYLETARRLSVKPEECIVFEDIEPGIMAGCNAGMRVCAVEDEYSLQMKSVKQKISDYYIKDYYEILDALDKIS